MKNIKNITNIKMKFLFNLLMMALIVITLASAQTYNCPMGGSGFGGFGSMMYGGYGTGAMLIGWLIGLAVLVALVLLIAWLVKQLQKEK